MHQLKQWLESLTSQHVVVGYGSLLSKDSRERFSNIHTTSLPVTVQGFERAWVTRSIQEKQTYVGAVTKSSSQLNAQLIPTDINPSLKEREKDYRFVKVNLQDIAFVNEGLDNLCLSYDALEQLSFWICETLDCVPPSLDFPVNQSYVDTCLSGCLEHGGVEEAKAFFATTQLWEHPRSNDRKNPQYPRAAKVSRDIQDEIDRIIGHV